MKTRHLKHHHVSEERLVETKKQMMFVLAAIFAVALSSAASADLLYDNGGDPDGSGGHSNILTDAGGGLDRRIGDDFILVGGPGWVVNNVEISYVWNTIGSGGATDFLVQFFADDAGGGPGTLISEQVTSDFTETATGNEFFDRPEQIFSVNITPIALAADTNYWVSIQPNGVENGFQLTTHSPHLFGDESYVFYPDLGHTDWVAGEVRFGVSHDMAFKLNGEAVGKPCPWDLDSSGSVGLSDLLELLEFWGDPYGLADLLDLLTAWGPCP